MFIELISGKAILRSLVTQTVAADVLQCCELFTRSRRPKTDDKEWRSIWEDDVRVKNAKERLKERRKLQEEGATQCQESKDIEESAMKEDNLSKLGVSFV